jgi:hypothetical protein
MHHQQTSLLVMLLLMLLVAIIVLIRIITNKLIIDPTTTTTNPSIPVQLATQQKKSDTINIIIIIVVVLIIIGGLILFLFKLYKSKSEIIEKLTASTLDYETIISGHYAPLVETLSRKIQTLNKDIIKKGHKLHSTKNYAKRRNNTTKE